jgi:hypothetical protein
MQVIMILNKNDYNGIIIILNKKDYNGIIIILNKNDYNPLVSLGFTPFNYFEWKSQILILLWSKGLYRITIKIETKPNFVVEKEKWFNKVDESLGLLCLSISPYLLFHIPCAPRWASKTSSDI